jgi:hypothetical protein
MLLFMVEIVGAMFLMIRLAIAFGHPTAQAARFTWKARLRSVAGGDPKQGGTGKHSKQLWSRAGQAGKTRFVLFRGSINERPGCPSSATGLGSSLPPQIPFPGLVGGP